MHRSNTQSGQALLLVMIAMVPICLVLGLVVDVGMAYFTKTSARAAAQSAALAAVQAAIDGISENGWTSYQCGQGPACQSSPATCATSLASNLQSACVYAEANGFAGSNILVDAGNGIPPGVDGVKGANYWVRVQITQQSPLTFGIFSGLQKLNVTASAVAAAANMMPLDCLVALNGSADDALSMAGNAVSRISGCGVGVDSNSSSALYVNGNTTLQAPWIRVVGTCGGNGCGAVSPAPTTGVPPFPDPLEGVPEPQVPDGCPESINYDTNLQSSPSSPLQPGIYYNGITIGANASVTFSPGTYCLVGGGLQVSGNASLSGSGVTFYNTFNSTY
ncbi:MAG TPA: pilus assembly protein TadG-related protein, partial [Bryobacteraceae bacterium]